MIMDSLVHVTADGGWFGRAIDASETRLLQEMDLAEVEKSVVVALAGYIENDFVLRVSARHPDRLIAGLSFNPSAHASAEAAVGAYRTEVQALAPQVLKLHPRLNAYDPLDPRCMAVLEELASQRCPPLVWLDTLLYRRGLSLRKSPVEAVQNLAGCFEALTFVLLHGAGSSVLQLAEAIRDCPNTFIDLSYTLCLYEGSSLWDDLRFLLRTFDRRLVFGSDFPEMTPATALHSFRRLARGVEDEKCENVLGLNLRHLLEKRCIPCDQKIARTT